MQLLKSLRHLLIGLLHAHGNLTQLLHLALRAGNGLRNAAPDLDKLFSRLIDIREGIPHALQLGLKVVRLLQHAGKGRAHLAQLPQGLDFLIYQLLLVFLQTFRHMQDWIKAFFLLRVVRLPPVFSRK